jgi:hypothetical protein
MEEYVMPWEWRYFFCACCLTFYVLGQKHALKQQGWKNVGVAVLCGAFWPLLAIYGLWISINEGGE